MHLIKLSFKLLFRDVKNVILMILPIILFVFSSEQNFEEIIKDKNAVGYIAPSSIGFIIALFGIFLLPILMTEYKSSRLFKQLKTTPLNPKHIMFSEVFTRLFILFLSILLIFAIGVLRYNLNFYGSYAWFLIGIILCIVYMVAFGMLLMILVGYENLKYFGSILILLSGVYPFELLAPFFKGISYISPITYGINLLKGIWLGIPLSALTIDIGVMLGVTIISSIVVFNRFDWN